MKINIKPNAIDIGVPTGMIFMGIIMITSSAMPILLTQNANLWWTVIEFVDISPFYLIFVYLNLSGGILFVSAGAFIFATHDKKLD